MRYHLILLSALSACSDGTQTDGGYPQLIPLAPLYAKAEEGSQIEAATASLQARAATLRRKAAALRGRSIIDGQERLRHLGLR